MKITLANDPHATMDRDTWSSRMEFLDFADGLSGEVSWLPGNGLEGDPGD